jgi:hypothetical protein
MKLWSEESNLYLFTPEEFAQLPSCFELTCIDGSTAYKGVDNVVCDTRFGHLAFGVVDPWNHPMKDLFLMFKLKE